MLVTSVQNSRSVSRAGMPCARATCIGAASAPNSRTAPKETHREPLYLCDSAVGVVFLMNSLCGLADFLLRFSRLSCGFLYFFRPFSSGRCDLAFALLRGVHALL